MTAHHASRNDRDRAIGPDTARRRHGTRAERVTALLTSGDPLADAALAELDLYGAEARRALDTGLRHGTTALRKQPPAAVAALLRQVESIPSWIDPLSLHRGDVVSQSVPPLWFGLCSITGTLAHVYASPAVARVLTRYSTTPVPAQLVDTGVWARKVVRPGGLLRGAPGYVATVELRLRHARIRSVALTDWNAGATGLPVGQLDLARAWLGFTLVAFEALAAVGIDIDPEEERQLYQYWSYVAHLLGLDEALHQDVTDHAGARRLKELLDAVTAGPDENSRDLTAAAVDAQSHAMADAPRITLSEEQIEALTRSVLRQAFGERAADRMGLTAPATTDLMPLIAALNRQARYWQTFSPASAREARRQSLEEPGPEAVPPLRPHGIALRQTRAANSATVPAA